MLLGLKKKLLLVLTILAFYASAGFAQTTGCDVPNGMKKEQKLPCIRASSILLDQPSLTSTQLTNGPDFDAAKPEVTRFKFFTDADTLHCHFRPHYVFQKRTINLFQRARQTIQPGL